MTIPKRMAEIVEAVNDTANDELYMGDEIGPIVTGEALQIPQPVMGGDITDNSTMGDPQTAPSTMAMPGSVPTDPQTAPAMTTASWKATDYLDAISKVASDSDLYHKGYQDRITGKSMDEGLANLSMDYFQGYEQGAFYNQEPLTTAPPQNMVNVRNPVIASQDKKCEICNERGGKFSKEEPTVHEDCLRYAEMGWIKGEE